MKVFNSDKNPNVLFLFLNGTIVSKLDKKIKKIFLAPFFWDEFEYASLTKNDVAQGFSEFVEELFKVSDVKVEIASNHEVKQWNVKDTEPVQKDEIKKPVNPTIKLGIRYLNYVHPGEFTMVESGFNKENNVYFEDGRARFSHQPKQKILIVDENSIWDALRQNLDMNKKEIEETIIKWVQKKFGISELRNVTQTNMRNWERFMVMIDDVENV